MRTELKAAIDHLDWTAITHALDQRGYVLLPNLLDATHCDDLIQLYDQPHHFRKTIEMARYRFGQGEYKYFDYPLPTSIQYMRESIYPHLVPLANQWRRALKLTESFPPSLHELLQLCKQYHQTKPTPLLLKYGKGGYNTLHQDLYGSIYFPLQAVLFLSSPRTDYNGGEFVMTEQRPRAQSKAAVIHGNKGDMLIFTTSFRPVKGKQTYYRVAMRHGVSEVLEGKRHTLGIIFHDAA